MCTFRISWDGSIIGEHKNGPFSICVFLTGKHIYIQIYITSILSEGAIWGLIWDGLIIGEHKNGPFSICVFLTENHIYVQLYIQLDTLLEL